MKTSAVALAIMAGAADALLNLDVNLPLGIDVDLDLLGSRPTSEPCAQCVDTWHPPHDVIIDDCDDTHNGDWHWVHPCPEDGDHPEPSYTWGTSTMTTTHVSTIISCGPEVPDCPAESTGYTTVTATEATTICPVPVEPTKVPEQPEHPEVPEKPEHPQYPEHPEAPTTAIYHPPAPTESHYSQPPPVHSEPVVYPSKTMSTMPHPEMPTAPVYPPVNTPVHPQPVPSHTYGHNATNPISTPPIVSHPPTAGAAQNGLNMGAALLAGLAAFALW